ncbi:hypothetical protein A3H66_00605 [Candidatus Falkowbacteria bacterium RIFCSPLOWO2_02_FULL_45_21]|uniref:tRNA dimethylallyltransferase n=1 Tax=Candidatus Falkowbacteria bacterium RIFCSPLOWO2_02_FULL_45_21 TaxID=1797989 RepID=A0A1F5SE69_9BACT|nr:MAG: hypothetical protein A3H66_00605 [Candidatus Falkowbacteria bacterium RIFCSPLOWO2_02_FULL_45_21]
MNYNKIIVILGPTASGKTKLAVELAREFNGEIVSADSRQVYKGMDVGSGKDLDEFTIFNFSAQVCRASQRLVRLGRRSPPACLAGRRVGGHGASGGQFSKKIQIPYHLIDVASPKKQFDLAKYQKLAFQAIDDILKRCKLPILAGGSGLYLQAVVDNYKLSRAKKDFSLRKKIEKFSAPELFQKLKTISPKMAAKLNHSDRNNQRRLVRYLEILKQGEGLKSSRGQKKYDALIIGLDVKSETLKQRIAKRLLLRLKKQNLIGEVEGLHEQGLSWVKLENFGLEYEFISLYLQKKIGYDEMIEKLIMASYQFSRRQLSWFRRWQRQGARINWLSDREEAAQLVSEFIK